MEKIGLILERLSDFVDALNLNISTILEITDEEKTHIISLVISGMKQEVLPERSPTINFIIKSPKDMWVRIFSGEESLMSNVVTGVAQVSNFRANWLSCMLLSMLISNLVTLKVLKVG